MARALLDIRGLRYAVDGRALIEDFDLRLLRGETVGLIGAPGSGRRQIVDLIAGRRPLSGGRILLEGRDLARYDRAGRARRGLYVSGDAATDAGELTVFEVVRLAAMARQGKTGRWWRRANGDRRLTAASWEALEAADLAARAGHAAAALDLLDRRRLDLAAVIARAPDVVLLDRPMGGLSGDQALAVLPLIERLRQSGESGLIFADDGLAAADLVADRVVALRDGGVVGQGPAEAMAGVLAWREVEVQPAGGAAHG